MAEVLMLTQDQASALGEPIADAVDEVHHLISSAGHTVRYLLSAVEMMELEETTGATMVTFIDDKVDAMSPAFDPATDWYHTVGDGEGVLQLYRKLKADHATLKLLDPDDYTKSIDSP